MALRQKTFLHPLDLAAHIASPQLLIYFPELKLVHTAILGSQCQNTVFIAVNPQFICQLGSDLPSSGSKTSRNGNRICFHTIPPL